MATITKNTVIKELKKVLRGKSIRHKKWNMNKIKRMIDCPNCGKSALTWVEDLEKILSPDETNKLEQVINLLKSHKDPYKKKLELFKLMKNLAVGEPEPNEKRRVDYLLQAHLYSDLAKQSMKDYKKITAETFSKVE